MRNDFWGLGLGDKIVLIVTHNRKGFTDYMAQAIAEGVDSNTYLDAKSVIKRVNEVELDELGEAGALAFGTPIYLDYISGELKHLLDNCHYFFNKKEPENRLAGVPAVAFTCGKYKDYHLLRLQFTPQVVKKLEDILIRVLKLKKVAKGIHFATHIKNRDPRHPLSLTERQKTLCNKIGRRLAEEVTIRRG